MRKKKAEVRGKGERNQTTKATSLCIAIVNCLFDHLEPAGLESYSVSPPDDSAENQANCNL